MLDALPGKQAWQSSSVLFEQKKHPSYSLYLPAWHAKQDDMPAKEYTPNPQKEQLVLALTGVKLPSGQGWHLLVPVELANVPETQAWHALEE
jgi:hypothetical protein